MPTQSMSEVWENVLQRVRQTVQDEQYKVWFSDLALESLTEEKMEVSVPDVFHKRWVEKHYGTIMRESAAATTGGSPDVVFQVRHVSDTLHMPEPNIAETSMNPVSVMLNEHCTFENFVVGPCNRLPHAAALAVADAPGQAYNPFFMHGSVGLGKTHLLQAICHALIQKAPDTKILYLSCEEFINQFISSVERGEMEMFRHKYRHVDLLVIDDIHFLADREGSQEEFFHTFNSLYNSRKQLVLSSDSSPTDIVSLEERLRSRFKWGLVTRLDPPDYETRAAIVQKKAKMRGVDLPSNVTQFVATKINSNIRELEGAVVRVLAYAALTNRQMDMKLAEEALEDSGSRRRLVKIEDIQQVVTERFGVRLSDLQSRKRSKSVAYPRQICMHLARLLTNHSLEEIGGYFGGRDHTTVMHADEKIRVLKESDSDLRRMLEDIIRQLQR